MLERVAEGLIRHGKWSEAILWITALPTELASQGRWRYWLGRALIDSGEGESAGRDHLAEIAGWRTFYGLLAAQDLGLEPRFLPRPASNDIAAQRALLTIRPYAAWWNCSPWGTPPTPPASGSMP